MKKTERKHEMFIEQLNMEGNGPAAIMCPGKTAKYLRETMNEILRKAADAQSEYFKEFKFLEKLDEIKDPNKVTSVLQTINPLPKIVTDVIIIAADELDWTLIESTFIVTHMLQEAANGALDWAKRMADQRIEKIIAESMNQSRIVKP